MPNIGYPPKNPIAIEAFIFYNPISQIASKSLLLVFNHYYIAEIGIMFTIFIKWSHNISDFESQEVKWKLYIKNEKEFFINVINEIKISDGKYIFNGKFLIWWWYFITWNSKTIFPNLF